MKLLKNISKLLGLPFGSIKPFPEISDVFKDNVEKAKETMFPICTIDLSYINRKWNGNIHLLLFNEDPYNMDTLPYFTTYCKDNMIGFELINNKYNFLSDYGYFNLSPDWKEWFELTKKNYLEAKDNYHESGKKYWINYIIPGGSPNWLQGDETPLDPDGNQMVFIAQYNTGKISSDYCEKEIYLFYSDKHRLAVQIYQTS